MGHACKNRVQLFIDAGMESYGDHAASAAANYQQPGGSPEGEDVIANIV